MVTLSVINGMLAQDGDEVSTSLVNELKIRKKRECSLRENMIFLPENMKEHGMRLRQSRLGGDP